MADEEGGTEAMDSILVGGANNGGDADKARLAAATNTDAATVAVLAAPFCA